MKRIHRDRAQGWAAHGSTGAPHEDPQSDRGHRWGDRRIRHRTRQPRVAARRAVVAGLVATGLVSSSLILPGIAAARRARVPGQRRGLPGPRLRHDRGLPGPRRPDRDASRSSAAAQVVGSAQAVVEAGDVAFEVNHPGGAAGAPAPGLKVTPDIVPGDRCRSSSDGDAAAATRSVGDACVTGDALAGRQTRSPSPATIAAGVNPAQLEQRIVNPDLTATGSASRRPRAARAAVAARKGGYSSESRDHRQHLHRHLRVRRPEDAADPPATGGRRAVHVLAGRGRATPTARASPSPSTASSAVPAWAAAPPVRPTWAPTAGTRSVIRSADKTVGPGQLDPATAVARRRAGQRLQRRRHRRRVGHRRAGQARRADRRRRHPGDDRRPRRPAEDYTFEVRSLAGRQDQRAVHESVPGTRREPAAARRHDGPPTLTPARGATAEPADRGGLVTAQQRRPRSGTRPTACRAVTGTAVRDRQAVHGAHPGHRADRAVGSRYFNDARQHCDRASGLHSPARRCRPRRAAARAGRSAIAADRVTLTWPAVTGATGYQVQVSTPAPAAPTQRRRS